MNVSYIGLLSKYKAPNKHLNTSYLNMIYCLGISVKLSGNYGSLKIIL